jgi:hypothetical protein
VPIEKSCLLPWQPSLFLGFALAISAVSSEVSRGDAVKKFFFGGGQAPRGIHESLAHGVLQR